MERGLVKTSAGYIHYRSTGHGKPILLLHAAPRSSAVFMELMQVLGRRLHALAIDTPSYGMSDHIEGQPTISDYAKIMKEVMESLGIEEAHILGEATGAYIAIEMANQYPEKVEKIILLSCPFFPAKDFSLTRRSALKAKYRTDATGFPLPRTLEDVLEKDPDHAPMNPTQLWMDRDNVALAESGRDLWQATDHASYRFDLKAGLERLRCPVLLLWGEHFYYLRQEGFQEEFIQRIKNLRIEIIKGGRFLLSVDRFDDVGEATLRFLAG